MKMRLGLLAASAVAMSIAGQASAIVIDDFTTGSTVMELSTVGTLETQQSGLNANIVGTQRDILLDVYENPSNRLVRFEIVGGSAKSFYAEGPDARGRVTLDYDGVDAEGNNGVQTAGPGLNLNLSAEDRFNLLFYFADLGVNIRVDAFTNGGGSSSRTFSIPAGIDNPAGQGVEIFFSGFTATSGSGVNWADVDRLTFRFDGPSAQDWTLGRIQAVPEPATMAAFGIGAIGLLARRRRKKA